MRISQLLNKKSIIADLKAADKKAAIKELAAAISTSTKASEKQIAEVLMDREHLGSTGIGGGIAIPHGKLDLIESTVIGFGLSKSGVEYDSLDNKPVHIFFVLLTSENSTGNHLKVLAQISKLLKMDQFKHSLLTADCVDDIHAIISEQDEDF
ncbi:MAG: PTS sugar transporter subunit IIA [Proteobacteria bacterium]|nr:PTS sugar transporter subunit IIA [Pseudomonadota bacterium]MBU1386986.1 PTS sugar transporter subunit IIA [Pseudomonadota bacterium]MBU1542333.1 PTS sugar transporter subunit IIA [Pseudomonadota bacterium]MBU2431461.1 PTS sugar transporter subunit IIA [Pseudomonadota bacterium]MBU2481796.1 PTS sugar transporter subunit IIA [Pseudomonadota bacterium]